MRALLFVILNLCLIAGMATAQQAQLTFPLQQELTLQEFLQFENTKGASIEKQNDEVFSFLTNDVYPFANKYKIAQPVRGIRIVDSTEVSFDCYFTEADSTVKYLSYDFSPAELNIKDLVERLEAEGKTSKEEIEKAIQESRNNPRFQKRNVQIFEQLKEYFSNELGKPNAIPDEENAFEHSKWSWEKGNLSIYLAYEGEEQKKLGIVTRIFWK